MIEPFPVVSVDRRLARNTEQLGTKRKFWFQREIHDETDWLFKAEERQTGEDWAEKIASELCKVLGIPHVAYELAIEESTDVRGVVCPNVASPPATLVLGNQLLVERDTSYPKSGDRKYGVSEHTIATVAEAVQRLALPPADYCMDMPAGIVTAVDVFAGYLMLDALIANQDRHHQNWGALRNDVPSRSSMLAPTFDHGAALARNEPEPKRERRLYGPDPNHNIANFARKARSSLYGAVSDLRPLSTLDAFTEFCSRYPTNSRGWLRRLNLVTDRDFESIIHRIPESRMSPTAREFTLQLLLINQSRLLSKSEGS